jgi:hypothetical protein
MVGDIKLATLSDTDTTNAVGTELVSNNSSFSNTTGWYLDAQNTSSGAIATIAASGGNLVFTHSNTNNSWDGFGTSGTFVVGQTYTIDTTIVSATNINVLRITDSASQHDADIATTINGAGTHSFTFVATATTMYFHWNGYYTTSAITLSKFSVRLAEQNRSVTGKGLQTFGTVTKTAVATGAELVGYSGWSSSNYLQQPYNADLQFGTGDFSIACWVKAGTANAYRRFISIQDPTGNQNNDDAINIKYAPFSNGFIYAYLGTSEGSIATAAGIPANIWQQVILLRSSGTYYLYLDGRLVSTKASTQTKGSTSHVLRVGVGAEGNESFSDGSIALVRISKTAPSPEQIKKMYNDEKHLFATNAKAVIGGTSDAVTALAYDDDTELLHVGSSWGRSVFQGLNRIEFSSNVVTTAISASNGFIVEE